MASVAGAEGEDGGCQPARAGQWGAAKAGGTYRP